MRLLNTRTFQLQDGAEVSTAGSGATELPRTEPRKAHKSTVEDESVTGQHGHLPVSRFAILSHRWGDDEVSYQEFSKLTKLAGGSAVHIAVVETKLRATAASRPGLAKILNACYIAAAKIEWLWVDTCCT
jgi:hypothetical protein